MSKKKELYMKKFNKKLTAIVLSTLFASMQISFADDLTGGLNTGLGTGLGGAQIDQITGGYAGHELGTNSATLNFNADSHVKWDTLNLNRGETLNFNAVDGVSGIKVLNTVNTGMSNIYGNINANSGVGQLIISNPNGVLFDGAHFSTAGDVMVTTQAINGLSDINNAAFTQLRDTNSKLIPVQIKNNSDFQIGGDYTIIAPQIYADASKIQAKNLKLVTANGQDYLSLGVASPANNVSSITLKAMNIDGNLYITNEAGATQIVNGGTITGDFTAETKNGMAWFNKESGGERLVVNGDVNINSDNEHLMLRNVDVDGDVNMKNVGGYVDIANADVKGDVNLTTEGVETGNKYHHFVHVIGDTNVGGDLNIESSQNVHIGGYTLDPNDPTSIGVLADGKLTVGGDINAHSEVGHITTTIDTSAKNITYKADKLNILTDGKATLKADKYSFSSNGFIGGITEKDGNTADQRISTLMENYIYIPADIEGHGNLNVDGGEIVAINTPKVSPAGNDVQVYINSKDNLKVTGANTGVLNLNAPRKRIDITGEDVHAKNINVASDTDYLKVDFPKRDYTLKYTNIRDGKVVTINQNDEITYGITDAEGGNNRPTLKPSEKTTYLIGPGAPVPPPPPQEDRPKDPNEPDRYLTNWVPEDVTKAPVSTPVAFAADLDDDEETMPVRKNVDGSVTVVRAFPMMN